MDKDLMGTDEVFEDEKDHVRNLLKWLRDEIETCPGDGDGIWLTQYRLSDLLPLVEETFACSHPNCPRPFSVSLNEFSIRCDREQASFVVTNDAKEFRNSPNWTQVKLEW